MKREAAQQGDEADDAGASDGASQLIPSVAQTCDNSEQAMKESTTQEAQPKRPAHHNPYGVRFAREMERLYPSLQRQQLILLRTLTPEQIAQGLQSRFAWLGPEWLERKSQAPPEVFARALAQEDARKEQPLADTPDVTAPLLIDALFTALSLTISL